MLQFEMVYLWILGPVHPTQPALLILMGLDLLTRQIVRQIKPSGRPEKFSRSLLKKSLLVLMVIAAHQIDLVLGQSQNLRNAVTYVLLGNELLSLVEQMAKAGVPIPRPLTRAIEALKGEADPEKHTEKTRT